MLSITHGHHAKGRIARAACRGGIAVAILLLPPACHPEPSAPLEGPSRESLALLMPRSIHIVKPFTTWANLDDVPGIDGLVVYVQPVNASGDPIQAAGKVYIELFTYRKASGDHEGKRLELWEFPLRSEADQQARWNRATQMYEFPVVLSRATMSAKTGDKFVLRVTHQSPLGVHRSDEYIVRVPLARGTLAGR